MYFLISFVKYIFLILLIVFIRNTLVYFKWFTGKREEKRTFFTLLLIFGILYSLLVFQNSRLLYFDKNIKEKPELFSFDKRNRYQDERTFRGDIYDRFCEENRVLVKTIYNSKKKKFERVYPLGESASHLIGYSDMKRGKAGMERAFEKILNGSTPGSLENYFNVSKNNLFRRVSIGSPVYLTIDSELQQLIYDSFGGKKGAAVVLEPSSGEILAMVSSPGFSPDYIQNDEKWKKISDNLEEAPVFNRVCNGKYPPGSIFKLIITALAIENNMAEKIYCGGDGYLPEDARRRVFDHEKVEYERQGKKWTGHGTLSIKDALAKSSNVYFSRLGNMLGGDIIEKNIGKYGFNKGIVWNTNNKILKEELKLEMSRFPLGKELTNIEIAWGSIGQGKVLSTPMHWGLITAAIANDGIMVKPVIEKGKKSRKFSRIMKESTAKELKILMRNVVEKGTGFRANVPGLEICGKTGTAEIGTGTPHSWFVAFAPLEKPVIASTVIFENGGYGGRAAALLTYKIYQYAKRNGYLK